MSELEQLPDGTVGSEHLGVRVFSVSGPTLQELIDRIAMILGEHMDADDDLHVTYNSMQNGSVIHDGLRLLKRNDEPWTELLFEYSALLVLRSRAQGPTPIAGE